MPTYFVDNVNGKDQNAGDQAHPFATIAKAVARAAPGDTIKVVSTDKPYTDYFAATSSGAPGRPITITSVTADKPKVTPGSSWAFTGDYWVVENFDFYGFKARPIQIGGCPLPGLGPDNDFADHIIVRDCLFRHATQEALWVCHTTDARIERCTFRDVRRREAGSDCCALCVYGGSGVVISDSLFEDIGSDGVHIGPKFHEIGAVAVQGCTFLVNRPYGSKPWQDFSTNVSENGIDIKGKWGSASAPVLVGPVLIAGCQVHGFRVSVKGQDSSDGVYGGQLECGIVIHDNATSVTIKDTTVHDCDVGVMAGKGLYGSTAGFTMTACALRDLDQGIECAEAKAGVTIDNCTIVAREALHIHSTPITFKNNTVDAAAYTRAGQSGLAETFSANRYLNALPPAAWQSNTDTTKSAVRTAIAGLTVTAAELEASASQLRQQANDLDGKAAAIRVTAGELEARANQLRQQTTALDAQAVAIRATAESLIAV